MFKVEPLLARLAGNAAVAPSSPTNLPVGSVFAVEAVRDSTSNQLLLLLAGRRFTLKPGGAAPEIEAGTRATVRVVRAEPDLELALVNVQKTGGVDAALRRELPQQGSPVRLLANLAWLAQHPEAASSLPAGVRTALASLWQAVPDAEQLATPAGLERACLASGVRLESALANATPAQLEAMLGRDWKGALCRAREALARAAGPRPAVATEPSDAPLPTRHGALTALEPERATLSSRLDPVSMLADLSTQVRESLARVACTQLASLDRHEQAALPLLLEVPYRPPQGDPGVLRLRIDRDAAGPASLSPAWSVEFALDLGEHGPLRGRVTLAEGRVSVTLQPESTGLAQAIDSRVDELRGALQSAGVAVGKLTCVRSDPFDGTRTGSWLIDLRA